MSEPTRVSSRSVTRWGPWLLAVSVVARFVWAFATPNGMNLVDLHVYVDGSAALINGHLYDFTYAVSTPDFPLPFTYPPFAALVFFPLHFLPFIVIGVGWQILTMGGLYLVVRLSLGLMLGDDRTSSWHWKCVAMAWTGVALWSEPVRTTLDYGQVNVFLALGTVVAVRSSRWWISGGLVGFVAGIKLTPAIAGLYFLARRRWSAAVFSAVAFVATVAVSYLVLGDQAKYYFTTLLGDASRIGPVGSVWNQSLRGALSRIAGYDVKSGPVVVIGLVIIAILAVLAWRALQPDDTLGTLVVVQFFGLLASPISWSHHWVWIVPMLVWLVHGPYRHVAGARIVAGVWLASIMVGVPWILSFFQPTIFEISRPGILAWLGGVDVYLSLALYLWIIFAGSRARRSPSPDLHPIR